MKSNFQRLTSSHPYVLVDFFAEWCGPCKQLAPVLKEIAAETKGKVKVVKVDVDKNQKIAANLSVRGVPTLILYKYSKQVWRQSGAMTKFELMKAINNFL